MNEYHPDKPSPPGETLRETLDSLDMTQKELAGATGYTAGRIGAVINHGALLTPELAIELEKALGIPASFWNAREKQYRESLK